MAEQMVLSGTLKGHNGWVTQIATTPQSPENILSASRDKTLILGELTPDDDKAYGVPKRSLHGHNHFVSDVVLSSDGQFALSGSWDHNLRLLICLLGKQLVSSLATLMMCSVLPSLLTTGRLYLVRVTSLSSCGTHWGSASIPSMRRLTPSGCQMFDSLQTLPTQSLFLVDGTNLSRSGT